MYIEYIHVYTSIYLRSDIQNKPDSYSNKRDAAQVTNRNLKRPSRGNDYKKFKLNKVILFNTIPKCKH